LKKSVKNDRGRENYLIYNINNINKMEEKKYKPIMIKSELKDLMDEKIIEIGKKMSYSQLIKYLLEKN
jgi:hypothetical protein